jgi:hypothetical protein
MPCFAFYVLGCACSEPLVWFFCDEMWFIFLGFPGHVLLSAACMPFVSWRFLFTMLLVLSKMFMDSLITYMVVGVSLGGSVTFKSPALKFLLWSDTRKEHK